MYNLKVEVVEIEGDCPVYSIGESFYIKDGFRLSVPEGRELCFHSLLSITPYYTALSRAISGNELGLNKNGGQGAYVHCLDPCEYTDGGTVVFSISPEEQGINH
ncbi:MAG: TIGR04076 family protein [Halanaerobiales bacterium]